METQKEIRDCQKHGQTQYFFERSTKKWRCGQCRVEGTQRRRNKLKLMALEYKGGKCQKCGYDKCPAALDFHHRDESEKSFGISKGGNTHGWDKLKVELDKCDILCANCHREQHYFKDCAIA